MFIYIATRKKMSNEATKEILSRISNSSSKQIHDSLSIIQEAMKRFQKPEALAFSFNGGKDCTLLLFLVLYAFQQQNWNISLLKIFYVMSQPVFEQVDQFATEISKLYSSIL